MTNKCDSQKANNCIIFSSNLIERICRIYSASGMLKCHVFYGELSKEKIDSILKSNISIHCIFKNDIKIIFSGAISSNYYFYFYYKHIKHSFFDISSADVGYYTAYHNNGFLHRENGTALFDKEQKSYSYFLETIRFNKNHYFLNIL